MAKSLTITKKATGGGRTLNFSKTYSGGAALSLDETIGIAADAFQIAFDLDVSEIQAIYINCTQAVTIYTNADTPGMDETIVLVANVPYMWTTDDETYGIVNVLATDLTDLYVDNDSGVEATLSVECVYDPTP